MKYRRSEGFDFHVSRKQVKNLEEHCRKIHAEAVAESFIILFSFPEKILKRLVKRKSKDHFAHTETSAT